jgi:hypothetical protein
MTLVLGIEDPTNNRAILVADSGAWKGDQKDILKRPKIWRSNGWIVGLSGIYLHAQRAMAVPCPELDVTTTRDEVEEAVLAWSDKMLDAIGANWERVKRIDPEAKTYAPCLLLAWGPWIFESQEGSAVSVERGFQAIGCEDYALGAFEALNVSDRSAEWMAHAIVLAVGRCTRNVERPFNWMATDGTEGVWE